MKTSEKIEWLKMQRIKGLTDAQIEKLFDALIKHQSIISINHLI